MQTIIDYLMNKYTPHTIVVYGSYANGSNNENSDFDALLITDGEYEQHDDSVVNEIQLDVFIYSTEKFLQINDSIQYIQIFDCKIILDDRGIAIESKRKVHDYIKNYPKKDKAEIKASVSWCKKMQLRTYRNDAEGLYRWHWLLVDSLEIFMDIKAEFYFGPKKAIKTMKEKYPEAYNKYYDALKSLDSTKLNKWIDYLSTFI